MLSFLKYGLYLLLLLLAFVTIYVLLNKAPDKSLEELSPRWAKAPSQFVNIAGINIHLRDEGPKNELEPIILIHGTAASLHTWDAWTETLKQNRRVIRFDLPGFGLTGPDPTNNYKIEHYADVVVAVLNELKIETAVLAGNSLGAYVAWATAVLHPEQVSKLILVDAMGYSYDPESVPIAFKISQNPIASVLLKNFIPKPLVERSVKNVYGDPDLVTDELVQRYYDLALREGNRDALKERFKQTLSGILVDELANISVPTLIIWGGKDKLIPLKFGKQFNKDIPNSQLVVFDDLGHVPHEENPESTVLAAERFLAEKPT